MYLYLLVDIFLFSPHPGMVLLTLALLRSLYLAYSLIFVTKIPCPLCFTSHAINLILFAVYLKTLFF